MKPTIIGNKNRYINKSKIGGKIAPITVEAAINIIIVITGPNIATNM
jgi:hypothetical protein